MHLTIQGGPLYESFMTGESHATSAHAGQHGPSRLRSMDAQQRRWRQPPDAPVLPCEDYSTCQVWWIAPPPMKGGASNSLRFALAALGFLGNGEKLGVLLIEIEEKSYALIYGCRGYLILKLLGPHGVRT